MKSKQEFIQSIEELIGRTIKSKTGTASYTRFRRAKNILTFKRVNTGQEWALNLDELYNIYISS